ncbi:hypothetical protein FQR65_LT04603 [Abscondita terminalis]|nr:hypothetical protein FQR65_LT04603 [Abscondita terminalis]
MDEDYIVKRDPNPRQKAGLLSILTFMYTLPIFFKGRKKDFTESDIYETLSRDNSKFLGDKAEKLWIEEMNKCKKNKTVPSVEKVLMAVQKFNLIKIFIGQSLNELIFRPSQAVFLRYIIFHYTDGTNNNIGTPYFYLAGLLLSSLGSSFTVPLTVLEGFHTGMDIKTAASCLVYRKALKLKQSGDGGSAGEIINLLSNDLGIFDRAIIVFHLVYIAPLQLVLFTILLYLELGLSSIIGISVLIILIPFQNFLGKLAAKYRFKFAFKTDSRVQLTNEIIRGIEVIKMYAWEKSFAKLIAHHRRMEVKLLTKCLYVKGSFFIYFVYISVPTFLTTFSYVLLGNEIDAQKVFYTIALYNVVSYNMGSYLPLAISILGEIKLSCRRIQKFLLLDEVDNRSSTIDGPPIQFKNVTAGWNATTERALTDISICIEKGTLIAVVGSVGSGKSSLLQSILGELSLTSGNLLLNGSISYASQQSWVFNSTIRQNILLGKDMIELRYKEVLNVCGLARDLKLFPAGDKMIAGERGSALSGGQKARVNLARAVYHDADVYLLDDPLSSVDVNVGKHIFDNCIRSFLRDKTVILITHQLKYLQHVDRIVFLENGKIKADGNFEQLQKMDLNFFKLLHADDAVEKKEKCANSTIKFNSALKLNEKNIVNEELQRSNRTVSIIDYASACGSKVMIVVVVFLFILVQLLFTGSLYFITYWVNYERTLNGNITYNVIEENNVTPRSYFIIVYTVFIVVLFLMTLLRNTVLFNFCMRTSTHLHDSMFQNIVYATMRFFNNNSAGRILNRFTKDMGVVDEQLPIAVAIWFQTVFSLIAVFIVGCVINYWMIIPSVILIFVSNYLKNFYLSSSTNIKRLEGITKSPVFTHLHETVQGLATIRAFGVQEKLKKNFDDKQDLNSCANFLFVCTTRALSFWIDLLSFTYLTIATLVVIYVSDVNNGGMIGFVITQVLQLCLLLHIGVRQFADMENYMTSLERILDYNFIDREQTLINKNTLHKLWPTSGKIVFENVCLSYSSNDLVLKNLNFTIEPEEKVGIIGRTGAGKSSIISCIFRLYEIDGTITIDDVNVQKIGLHDLRKRISVIPQNPLMFAGSIRKNLDPFDEHTDDDLWKALKEVNMKDAVQALDMGLQMEIYEGGLNLSVGQRQLICLARAIIRDNKILILDEATANVDSQSDAVIHETIRRNFSKCTVLTIAHRLQTIMDSDRILVMDAGEVVEFDRPNTLLQNSDSVFYKMVQQVDENIILG